MSPPALPVTTENAPVSSTHIAGGDNVAELVINNVDSNSSSESNPDEETQKDVILKDDSIFYLPEEQTKN
eukprot:10862744-Ditylum_brightwellii.AAC.1